jgi:hypothetical protein
MLRVSLAWTDREARRTNPDRKTHVSGKVDRINDGFETKRAGCDDMPTRWNGAKLEPVLTAITLRRRRAV